MAAKARTERFTEPRRHRRGRGEDPRIADRLQRRGYGVMRQRHDRAGRVYHVFKATWVGNGRSRRTTRSRQHEIDGLEHSS